MNKTVYLAGPITGMLKGAANDWRYEFAEQLKDHGIIGISPLRCEPLVGERYGGTYADPKFGTARAIASKNLYDVQSCDMTLAFMPATARIDSGHLSSGTLIEIGWANAFRKPLVLVSDDLEAYNHPVVNAACGWVLDNLDDGLEVVLGILGGYTGGKNV